MRNVIIDRAELLEILNANRQTHREAYEEACEEYAKEAAALFRDKAERAEAGMVVDPHIDLEKPREFLDDYDRNIRMVEMHDEPTVKLSEKEFRQLVQDEWSWSGTFESTTESYL